MKYIRRRTLIREWLQVKEQIAIVMKDTKPTTTRYDTLFIVVGETFLERRILSKTNFLSSMQTTYTFNNGKHLNKTYQSIFPFISTKSVLV